MEHQTSIYASPAMPVIDWNEVDGDLLACIFAKLPLHAMIHLARVCHRWARVARDPFWKPDLLVFAWGDAPLTGLAKASPRPTLLEFSLQHAVRQIACANSATFALTAAGQVWQWGLCPGRPWGGGCLEVNREPKCLKGPRDVVHIACSSPGYYHSRVHYEHIYHAAAVGRDGSLWTWGNADAGQLCVSETCVDGELSKEDTLFVAAQVSAHQHVSWVRHPMRVSQFGAPSRAAKAAAQGAPAPSDKVQPTSPLRATARVRAAACGMQWTVLYVERDQVVDEAAAEATAAAWDAKSATAPGAVGILAEELAALAGAVDLDEDARDPLAPPGSRCRGNALGCALYPHDPQRLVLAQSDSMWPSDWRSQLEGQPPGSGLLTRDGKRVELRAGVLWQRTTSVETCGRWCNEAPHALSSWPELAGVPVRQLAAGAFHCCVVTTSGQLFTFGDQIGRDVSNGNLLGICEANDALSRGVRTPRRVQMPHPVAEVAASTYCSSAVTAGGEVYTWGDSDGGALGHDELECHEPKRVDAIKGHSVAHTSTSYTNSAATTHEGRVFVWGGQLWEGGIAKDAAGSAGGPTEVEWGGLPDCYKCESVSLAHRHGYLLFTKRDTAELYALSPGLHA